MKAEPTVIYLLSHLPNRSDARWRKLDKAERKLIDVARYDARNVSEEIRGRLQQILERLNGARP